MLTMYIATNTFLTHREANFLHHRHTHQAELSGNYPLSSVSRHIVHLPTSKKYNFETKSLQLKDIGGDKNYKVK